MPWQSPDFVSRPRAARSAGLPVGARHRFVEELLCALWSLAAERLELPSLNFIVGDKEMFDLVEPLGIHVLERVVLGRIVGRLDDRHEAIVANRLAVFGLLGF